MHPGTAWASLGSLLIRRRIELHPRYRNRRIFCSERGIDYRIANDLELGNRDNYEPATIAAFELAYELRPGAIARYLDTGDPAVITGPAPAGRHAASNGHGPRPAPLPTLAELMALPGVDEELRVVVTEWAGQREPPPDANLEWEAGIQHASKPTPEWPVPRLTPEQAAQLVAVTRVMLRRYREQAGAENTG